MSSVIKTSSAIAECAEARSQTPHERRQPPHGRCKKKFLSPGAERMRLHRARWRRGLRCVTIEIRLVEVDELARRGYLSRADGDDDNAVIDAIHRLLDETLHSTERRTAPPARKRDA
jgi:hypothetical protein